MKKLLIIAHTPSPNTQALADAIYQGATDQQIDGVTSTLLSPFDATVEHVLSSDAIILFTTENFGYMSGALKDFFDRTYYGCLDKTDGKPFALAIRAGLDGTGTDIAVHKIVSGLKWREVQPVMLCKGKYQDKFITQCRELGMTVAAGLDADIF